MKKTDATAKQRECPVQIGMEVKIPRDHIDTGEFVAKKDITPAKIVEIDPTSENVWKVGCQLDNSEVVVFWKITLEGEQPMVTPLHEIRLTLKDMLEAG